MNHSKSSQIMSLVILILLGAFLVVYPGSALDMVVRILGIGLLVSAAVRIISLAMQKAPFDAAMFAWTGAIVMAVVGLVVLLNPGLVISIFPIIAGVTILLYGISGFVNSMSYKSGGFAGWQVSLVFSILTIAFGVLILTNIFGTAIMIVRMIGFILMYNAVSEIWFQIRRG